MTSGSDHLDGSQQPSCGKPYSADDPFEGRNVVFEHRDETELMEMAFALAEECVRLGWSEDKILRVFRSPFYQRPHLVWRQKGETVVKTIIQEALATWRPSAVKSRRGS